MPRATVIQGIEKGTPASFATPPRALWQVGRRWIWVAHFDPPLIQGLVHPLFPSPGYTFFPSKGSFDPGLGCDGPTDSCLSNRRRLLYLVGQPSFLPLLKKRMGVYPPGPCLTPTNRNGMPFNLPHGATRTGQPPVENGRLKVRWSYCEFDRPSS